MKRYIKLSMLVALVLVTIAATAWAASTLKTYGKIKGRSYHKELYDGKNCAACHKTKKPKGYPSDKACMECHDLEDLVKSTARTGEDMWQNPHNNLHYGKDVPCLECHGEHAPREIMCNGCHNFKFPKHKK